MQPFVLITMKEADHVILNPDLSSSYVMTREKLNLSTTVDAFLVLSDFGHMLPVGVIHLEVRFCTSRKGGCTPLGDSAWWQLQLAVEKP